MAVKKKAKTVKKKNVIESQPVPVELTPEEVAEIKKTSVEAKAGLDKAKELLNKSESSFRFSKFGQLVSLDLVSKDGVWVIEQPALLDEIHRMCRTYHEKKAVEYRDEAEALINGLPV